MATAHCTDQYHSPDITQIDAMHVIIDDVKSRPKDTLTIHNHTHSHCVHLYISNHFSYSKFLQVRRQVH